MSQTRVQLIGESFDNGANFAGVLTATDFKKSDGSTIESGGGGVGIALSTHPQSALKHVFKTPKVLEVSPSAFETIESDEEHIDFLINNAGASWGEPYAEYSEKGWDKVMDLNVKSIFYLTQKLTPILKTKASIDNPSRVINIGSIDGLNVPALESYAYGASKAAVHHLTRVQAKSCLLYTSPSPRDLSTSRMPSSA